MVRYLRTSSRHNGCRDTTSLEILSARTASDRSQTDCQEKKAKRKAKKKPKARTISPNSNPLNSPLAKKKGTK